MPYLYGICAVFCQGIHTDFVTITNNESDSFGSGLYRKLRCAQFSYAHGISRWFGIRDKLRKRVSRAISYINGTVCVYEVSVLRVCD